MSRIKLPSAPKARGELAEARFIAKALSLGYSVAKPFGDSEPYDFIVNAADHLSRVQVKSAWRATPRGTFQFVSSPIQSRGHRACPYRGDEIDFLVAYIAPEDAWFVLPVDVLLRHNHLHLSLDPTHPFARYREAWHLLERVTIHACAATQVPLKELLFSALCRIGTPVLVFSSSLGPPRVHAA